MKKPKTVRQLNEKFNARYSPNEISNSVELQTLHQYLAKQCKMANGNYIHIPSDYICDLIFKHLGECMDDTEIYQKDDKTDTYK